MSVSPTLLFLFMLGLTTGSPISMSTSASTNAWAVPTTIPSTSIPVFSNLKCSCIQFSPLTSPVSCSIPSFQDMDWATARALSHSRHVDIHFASQATAYQALDVAPLLPISLLHSMCSELPLPLPLPLDYLSSREEDTEKIVCCGVGEEVNEKWLQMTERAYKYKNLDWFVLQVAVWVVLLIVAYEVLEAVWTRIVEKKRLPGAVPIHLAGDEKLPMPASDDADVDVERR
ncbi:hypothetical protein K504DRAFT_502418 [Pleomassaria siparia CBS 279.74]|uniref:Uncharacterized protein n=1 Tax=Pleomassaria siparia CBS 279.74 TaxID=1314801 RepID=A0A6G1KB61_9PLEO|nr:hypothetical protein K504DRAFT_502418 [Pleomassaria siparia CBS 279.74]